MASPSLKTAGTRAGRVVVVCATDEEAEHVISGLEGPCEQRMDARGAVTPHTALRVDAHGGGAPSSAKGEPSAVAGTGWRFVTGRVRARDVCVLVCRVGVAHAATAVTTLLCTSASPACVVSCGCAGAHVPEMRCGDVVIGTSVVPLAACKILPCGTRQQAGIRVGMSLDEPGGNYGCDGGLIEAALVALVVGGSGASGETPEGAYVPLTATAPLPVWPGDAKVPSVWMGPVSSTDEFNQHVESLRQHARSVRSVCEEMEAVGVAAACAEAAVPFIAVKDIANNELVDGQSWGDRNLVPELGKRAAVATLALLHTLQ